jgi:hypothetical protein
MQNKLPNPKILKQEALLQAAKKQNDFHKEKQKQEALTRERIEKETKSLIPYALEKIQKATSNGFTTTSLYFDKNGCYLTDSIYNLANVIRSEDYKVFTRHDTVDYGDSAAPCVRDRLILDIDWG